MVPPVDGARSFLLLFDLRKRFLVVGLDVIRVAKALSEAHGGPRRTLSPLFSLELGLECGGGPAHVRVVSQGQGVVGHELSHVQAIVLLIA